MVESISIHPRYSGPKRVHFDVALLHMIEDFNLEKNIDTICLPEFPDRTEGNYDSQDCHIMGWGVDTFESQQYSVILKQAKLPIVQNNQCQNLLRNTRLSNTFKLHGSFLCAGGGKQDACKGDGGGPLICSDSRDSNRYV